MMITETTIHCPAKDCAERLWNRNEELFSHLKELQDILYKKDPDFEGDEWEILDKIEHLAFCNQPDICDVIYKLTEN